jgi:glycosyltransferase involved in cell wall biosynthesis
MKALGYIHTFNDEDVIDCALAALQRQTRPLDGIVLVDNNSTDGTLTRTFPPGVTILRHPENRGTSGAVASGFRFAMKHEYDWIWIIDADSAARPDALEILLDLYASFDRELRARTWLLASLAVDAHTGEPYKVTTGLLTWAQESMQPRGPHTPRSAVSLGTEAPGH